MRTTKHHALAAACALALFAGGVQAMNGGANNGRSTSKALAQIAPIGNDVNSIAFAVERPTENRVTDGCMNCFP